MTVYLFFAMFLTNFISKLLIIVTYDYAISSLYSAFIPNMDTHDNFLVTHEILFAFDRKRNGKAIQL